MPLVPSSIREELEGGDATLASLRLDAEVSALLAEGQDLATVAATIECVRAVITEAGLAPMLPAIDAQAQYIAQLRGEPFTPLSDAILGDPGHAVIRAQHWLRQTAVALLFGEHVAAVEALRNASGAALAQTGELELYGALVYARAGDVATVRLHADRGDRWAALHPDAGSRWQLVVAAELARLEGRIADAERLYGTAAEEARRLKQSQLEGIALEHAAELYASTGRPIVAAELRAQAHACWRTWGAFGILARRAGAERAPAELPMASSLEQIDVTTMIEMAHAVASELVIDKLVARLMTLALEHAGASRAVLIMPERGELAVIAEATATGGTAMRTSPQPLADEALPATVIRYVSRTFESLILDDAAAEHAYASDGYFAANRVRSVFALPLVMGARLTGILYLENELASHVFTEARLGVLRLFVSQAAIALENARLFAELRRTEQYRREAQRLSNTGSFSWHLASDEIRWSEQVYAIYEYPLELAITPRHLVERAHPDDRDRMDAVLADLASGAVDIEVRLAVPGGLKRVQIVARVQHGELAGAVIDVTERRLAEQTLRAAQHRFAVTVASIADGVIATDAAGIITYLNPVAGELTGVRPEDAIGQPLAAVMQLGPEVEVQQSQLADGAEAGSVVVLRDTSRRRQADVALALAAANQSLEVALLGSNIGIWETDYRAGTTPPPFHTINFWEALGWESPPEANESTGTMYRPERFNTEDRTALYVKVAAHLRGELDEVHCEVRLRAPGGSYRWCVFRARCVRDAAGVPTRLIGTSVDITDRRILEDEIRAATVVADQANRSKDEFLANVSHEVRTPMNAIIGMTELTLETALSDEQRHWISTVKSAADNLLVIIDELLDFSKAAANKLELAISDFSLHRQLEETLRGFSVTAHRKGLALIMDIGDDVPEMLCGDATRLRQIVANLVGNAIKFTAAGEVEVIVRRVHSDAAETVLSFAVRDTGIGIADEDHAAIFEPFTQADVSTTRRFGGAGLGLSIAMRLAALMDGRIEVESKRGKGSTFTLTARFGLSPAAPARLLVPPANARVLVVDANEAERALFAKWLRSGGMRVATAAGGVAAIDMLWDSVMAGDPIEYVLVDVALPGSAGALLVQRIRDRSSLAGCHVIQMPGQLAKPFGKAELFEAIHRARATASSSVAAQALRILVAEDSEFNADLIRILLRRRGYEPHIVDNGHAAVQLVEQGGFAVLLLDLHMPGLDGFQVIERIRAHERVAGGHLPVVALTARSRTEDRERCLAAGMDAFLGKPIRSTALWDTIDRLVRR